MIQDFAKTRPRASGGKFIKLLVPSGFDKKKNKRETYEKNRQRYIDRAIKWNKENKEKRKITKDRWRAKNKPLTNFLAKQYIYRKKGAGGYPTFKQVTELYDKFLGLCSYCGLNKATSIDHVIPISRGGNNNIENLTPACGSCNSSKGAKLLKEWKPELYD